MRRPICCAGPRRIVGAVTEALAILIADPALNREGGRTLARMGLAGEGPEAIRRLVEEGDGL